MIRPMPESEPVGDGKNAPEDRVPIFTEEVDSLQIFEDHDTRGDDSYPPIQRPPIFPLVFAPPPANQES